MFTVQSLWKKTLLLRRSYKFIVNKTRPAWSFKSLPIHKLSTGMHESEIKNTRENLNQLPENSTFKESITKKEHTSSPLQFIDARTWRFLNDRALSSHLLSPLLTLALYLLFRRLFTIRLLRFSSKVDSTWKLCLTLLHTLPIRNTSSGKVSFLRHPTGV